MLKICTKSLLCATVTQKLTALAIRDNFPIANEKARTQVKNHRIRAD